VPQVQLAMQLEDEQDQMIQDDVLDADLGEVFTRRWVVELILDLVGYTADRDLAPMSVTEPACGEGAFLGPIIERLVVSASNHGRRPDELAGSVRAFDLSQLNVERARKLCISRLVDSGLPVEVAEELAAAWVTRADFLLAEESPNAQFVVGNPPYIRLENVPAARTDLYRAVCPTMRGRSDVYVGFIERALRRLEPGGALGFIVADRWMHNQYGAHLRRLITDEFSMEVVVEMHEVDAFEDEVSAHPAVIDEASSQRCSPPQPATSDLLTLTSFGRGSPGPGGRSSAVRSAPHVYPPGSRVGTCGRAAILDSSPSCGSLRTTSEPSRTTQQEPE
jgi:hypothetical protein